MSENRFLMDNDFDNDGFSFKRRQREEEAIILMPKIPY